MNDPAWWARVVQARTERTCCRSGCGRCTRASTPLTIDLKAVPGIGAEIVLTVDREWRNMPLFRSHEQAKLVGAIADTRTMLEGKGWA